MPKKDTARSFDRAVSKSHAWAGWDDLLLGLFVGVDHVARLVFGRRNDGQGFRVLELIDGVALDAAELRLEYPRLRPFAIGRKLDVADDGLERGLAQIIGELAVVEALGGGDRLAQHVEVSIAERRHIVAQRIDAGFGGALLVRFQECLGAFEHQRFRRQPEVVVHEAVERRPELGLELDCGPTMAPPIIFGLSLASFTASTMPTESSG